LVRPTGELWITPKGARPGRATWGRPKAWLGELEGDRMTKPYLVPTIEFFDRASVPPEISDLLDEWPEIDPGTARLIRAALILSPVSYSSVKARTGSPRAICSCCSASCSRRVLTRRVVVVSANARK
jgi:hypothetical protein